MTESLISIIPGFSTKQEGISDNRACKLFKYLWNKLYSNYPVRIIQNAHDFGSYPDIGISDSLFSQGIDDTTLRLTHDGIESECFALVDLWNNKVMWYKISPRAWEVIKSRTGLIDIKPFTMEY